MDREQYRVEHLHPKMQGPVTGLTKATGGRVFESDSKKFILRPFEGFRSAVRQQHLFAGGKVTKARPWQSAHQYGLAVDFAGVRVEMNGNIVPNSWFWPASTHPCWMELKRLAIAEGLDVPIAWDIGHVEHPVFPLLKSLLAKY